MSSVIIAGNTSGSVTLFAPDVSGTTVLTLPTANGTVLTTTSPKTGNVLQVVQGTTTTQVTTSSSTFADTTLTASITPTSSSSKILVIVHQNGLYKTNGNASNSISLKLLRNSSDIMLFAAYTGFQSLAQFLTAGSSSGAFLDSPATTSSVTYKTQIASTLNTSYVSCQQDAQVSSITLMEIAA